MVYGNVIITDFEYRLGALVIFSCFLGYVLEFSGFFNVIECVDFIEFYWNDIELVCKGEFFIFIGSFLVYRLFLSRGF